MMFRRSPARSIAAVACVIALGLLGACGGDDDEEASSADNGVEVQEQGAGGGALAYGERGIDQADSDVTGVGAPQVDTSAPALPSTVVKTAHLRIDIPKDEIDLAIADAIGVAGRFGGFVVTTSSQEDGGIVTIRVPSSRFEQALSAMGDVGDVTGQEISGEDVAQSVIDLEARLRHATAQEEVMLRLMSDATTVADTIRVQHELEEIQLQIEELRGQLRYLDDQTSFSTISASFTELGAPVPKEPTALASAWGPSRSDRRIDRERHDHRAGFPCAGRSRPGVALHTPEAMAAPVPRDKRHLVRSSLRMVKEGDSRCP